MSANDENGEVQTVVTAPTRAMSEQSAGEGQPLPETVRHHFETTMGANFADIRIHEGQQAALVGAKAFTKDNNIYFRSGEYQPHTPSGRDLLGHELAHNVQQAGTGYVPVARGLLVVRQLPRP